MNERMAGFLQGFCSLVVGEHVDPFIGEQDFHDTDMTFLDSEHERCAAVIVLFVDIYIGTGDQELRSFETSAICCHGKSGLASEPDVDAAPFYVWREFLEIAES